VNDRLTKSRVLALLVGYHSLVSLFSRFFIGLLGYRGGTRLRVPTAQYPIKLSFTSCYPVPVTWIYGEMKTGGVAYNKE
jgi:hypothetical protein